MIVRNFVFTVPFFFICLGIIYTKGLKDNININSKAESLPAVM